jgi:hypothetical protein
MTYRAPYRCQAHCLCSLWSRIGVKGNGTCALASKTPRPEDLQLHPDYDVYVKSQRSPHCQPDRLYRIGNGSGIGGRQERRNETRPTTRFGSGLWGPTMPSVLSSPRWELRDY